MKESSGLPRSGRTILIAAAAVILLIIIGGVLWFTVINKPAVQTPTPSAKPSETPTKVPTIAPSPLPSPLVQPDRSSVLPIEPGDDFQAKFESFVESAADRDVLTYIALKKGDGSYFSFADFTEALGIQIPSSLSEHLDDSANNYTILAMRTETRPSLTLVIQVNDEDTMMDELRDDEENLGGDFEALLLEGVPAPDETSFSDGEFEGIDFRFVRLPDANRGIAYALIENRLIISTSRDIFQNVVNRLIPPENAPK